MRSKPHRLAESMSSGKSIITTLNDYFDKIYCINLDRRTDRWKETRVEFKKHNMKVERFSAVDGQNLDHPDPLLKAEAGCLLSHLEIIKSARKQNLRSVLIFEDDIIFHSNFNALFFMFIRMVPADWDMLYFCGNYEEEKPLKMVNRFIGRLNTTLITNAYCVRKSIYDLIIGTLTEKSKPIDRHYCDIQKVAKCYGFVPHLISPRKSYSDIQQRVVDYSFISRG